ncbi:hypothetical protein [Dyadobacter alkalitolerans]|uniref:hypothetical protein n=1 Tax=Dyadobacter alkalitolerans TaxID=492736 RepID=UPI0003FD32BF|nr:hypothetical protein [Dyadobacter alkalitolerans]
MAKEKKVGEDLYSQVILGIFNKNYTEGARTVDFPREQLTEMAVSLGLSAAKNLGDIPYTFRYRRALPESIRQLAPEGEEWVIRSVGRSLYQFALTKSLGKIKPSEMMAETKVPDSTPGVIQRYALNDEQSLLAMLRYNRLIDIFTGLTCYSLQNHLRTTVPGIGQVETDELYIGIDKRGAHYAIPVQAKGGRDILGVIQIEQDFALCEAKFPSLICKPIAAQFMPDGSIAIFEFENTSDGIKISTEKHYRLVQLSELTNEELESYKSRTV